MQKRGFVRKLRGLLLLFFAFACYYVTTWTNYNSNTIAEALSQFPNSRTFAYVMFVNSGYLHLTKNWICNIRKLDAKILTSVLFFTEHPKTTAELLSFDPGLKVFTGGHESSGPLSFGTLPYFKLTMQRLEIQNALLQGLETNQRRCLMMIEADATWLISDVDEELARLFEAFPLISADNADHSEDQSTREISAGFSGFCPTRDVKNLFAEYTSQYRTKLSRAKRSNPLLGEQLLLSQMIDATRTEVYWLDSCKYATGLWYISDEYRKKCPSPTVLQNNYIIGNDEKVKRAKENRHWFLHHSGKQCSTG